MYPSSIYYAFNETLISLSGDFWFIHWVGRESHTIWEGFMI